jgi:hypothetical protein
VIIESHNEKLVQGQPPFVATAPRAVAVMSLLS